MTHASLRAQHVVAACRMAEAGLNNPLLAAYVLVRERMEAIKRIRQLAEAVPNGQVVIDSHDFAVIANEYFELYGDPPSKTHETVAA